MLRLIPLALLLAVLALAGCGGGRRGGRADDRRDRRPRRAAAQGRPDRRPGPARRQRLQRARLHGAEARRGGARDQGAGDRVRLRGRLHPEHDLAGAAAATTSIIGVGFAQGDAIGKVAQRFPETKFAIIDVDQAFVPGKPANVQGLLFREEEVGYLAGYLAGLEEKRRAGKDVISAVGGFKEPPVDRFIAGYFAGAEKAAPGIKTDPRLLAGLGRPGEVQGAGAEPDRARLERRSSRSRAAAASARSTRPASASRWGIGVDADQSFLGDHILTSAQKGVDAAVFLTIKAVQDGSWKGGGNATFGLKEEGVGLGKVSPDGAAGGHRQGRRDQAADRGRRDHGDPDDRREELAAGDRGDDSDLGGRRHGGLQVVYALAVDVDVDERPNLAVLVEDEIPDRESPQRVADRRGVDVELASGRRPRSPAGRAGARSPRR